MEVPNSSPEKDATKENNNLGGEFFFEFPNASMEKEATNVNENNNLWFNKKA